MQMTPVPRERIELFLDRTFLEGGGSPKNVSILFDSLNQKGVHFFLSRATRWTERTTTTTKKLADHRASSFLFPRGVDVGGGGGGQRKLGKTKLGKQETGPQLSDSINGGPGG